MAGRTRPHTILIEGTTFINNETTNNSAIIRTKAVTVEQKLALVMRVSRQRRAQLPSTSKPRMRPLAVTNLRVTNALTGTRAVRNLALDAAMLSHHYNAALLKRANHDLNWNSALTVTSGVIGNSTRRPYPTLAA